MDIQIYGENVTISEELKEHANQKCQKFKSLVGNSVIKLRVKVDEHKQPLVKLDVHLNGHDYHVDGHGKNIKSSITEVVNKTHILLHSKNKKEKQVPKVKLILE